jgi:hypothetical protein
MSVSEASPEYWRTLYLAGFSPSDAVKEFTSQTSSATGDFRAAWLTRNRASDEKRIRVAYEVVTPESAGAGDAEDRGWVDEEGIEVDDLVEAARLIQHDVGTPEPSSSQFHKGVWYTGLYNEDYRSGADTFRSYHPYGFTEAEERELYGILTNYRGIHRRRNGERPPPPPRPRHTDTLRHVRRMVREHDKPFDPEAPREHYARSHHFAVNHHDLVGFNEWRGVLEYAETGGPLYYQAPLDRGPELLRPGKNEPYSYEVRARTIRIWPPGSVGRGRNRTSDAFTADAGHLERFSRPGH